MKTSLITAAILGVVLGAPVIAGEAVPQVSQPYQESFSKAWNKVNTGELPVYECIHVADVAAREATNKNAVAEARNAYRLCYVDSALRYSQTYFDLHSNAEIGDDGKPRGCNMYAVYLRGHVSALEARLPALGFSADELNGEINQRLSGNASKCGFSL